MKRILIVAASMAAFSISGIGPSAAIGEEVVSICHRPPGNPAAAQQLAVGPGAAAAHLSQHPFDNLGSCDICGPQTFCTQQQ
ncbi:MAG TPA: hypothetical protein VGH38_37825 [Bryobacteraceae bacterium]|jgi:hypothetical protein